MSEESVPVDARIDRFAAHGVADREPGPHLFRRGVDRVHLEPEARAGAPRQRAHSQLIDRPRRRPEVVRRVVLERRATLTRADARDRRVVYGIDHNEDDASLEGFEKHGVHAVRLGRE